MAAGTAYYRLVLRRRGTWFFRDPADEDGLP
jgi:hypothetical protein